MEEGDEQQQEEETFLTSLLEMVDGHIKETEDVQVIKTPK